MLYSHNNSRPAPLPHRIRLADGSTRTDRATFTTEEIAEAGYTGPFVEPPYNPATQQLNWVDGAYVISDLPPPPPQARWQEFQAALAINPAVNQMLGQILSAGLHALYGSLFVGMGQAGQGSAVTFGIAWGQAAQLGFVTPELAATLLQLATASDLPESVIQALSPQQPDADPED